MPQVWLITGCSSGFGADLALIALKAGHKVIATSRNPSKTPELVAQVEQLGGTWLTLDICDKNLDRVFDQALEIHGRIDVLVNNAGYSLLGAVEDMSDEECRLQMDTNFFGPLKLLKLALPEMRERKSGTIVNVSSIAGIDSLPTCGLYSASKHALEAVTESLSREVEPFGVRCLLVEPGGFRTNFLSAYVPTAKGMSPAYRGSPVEVALNKFEAANGKQPGDTHKACQAMLDVITGTGAAAGLKKKYLRLPLGKDCAARIQAKADALNETLRDLEPIWSSTDVD